MIPLWAKLAAIAALLAAVAGYGHHLGAEGVQADWDAQVREDKEAADLLREVNRANAHEAGKVYAAKSAARASATQPSQEATYALHATICPPPGALGKPLELGDVPIPRAQLDRLRNAGADY